MKVSVPHIVTWNRALSRKKSLKFEQQNELILKRTLKKLYASIFLQEFAIHDYKSLPQAEKF